MPVCSLHGVRFETEPLASSRRRALGSSAHSAPRAASRTRSLKRPRGKSSTHFPFLSNTTVVCKSIHTPCASPHLLVLQPEAEHDTICHEAEERNRNSLIVKMLEVLIAETC